MLLHMTVDPSWILCPRDGRLVQARLVRSNLQLKDGGAKVTARISQLRQRLAALEAKENLQGSQAQGFQGLRGSSKRGELSTMVPVPETSPTVRSTIPS